MNATFMFFYKAGQNTKKDLDSQIGLEGFSIVVSAMISY